MKRSEILEKYKDLIQEDVELVRLEPVDDLSDDTASSVLNKFDGSILALFILSQKTSKDGFVEKYMFITLEVWLHKNLFVMPFGLLYRRSILASYVSCETLFVII